MTTDILSSNHWRIAGFRQQMTRSELRAAILQGGNILRRGEVCYLRSKSLGAGMYNVK